MANKSIDTLLNELHRLKQEHSAFKSKCEQELAALRKAAKQSKEEGEKHRRLLESIQHERKEELKRAAEKIRTGSDKYRALIEHMMEGLLLVDNDDVIQVVNPAFCKMLGYTNEDELLGKTGYEILLKASDQERIIRKNKEREEGKSEQYEIDLLKKSGESIQVLMNASPVRDKSGQVMGSMSTCIDISERKLAADSLRQVESRYRSIIAVSNTGAWEFHRKSNYLWCSKEYFEMLGEDFRKFTMNGSSNLDESWIDLIHPDDRQKAAAHFAYYLEAGSVGMYENFFRMRHADGSWVWIWSRGQTLRNPDGSISDLTVGAHINITEQKQVEEALKQQKDKFAKILLTAPAAICMFCRKPDGSTFYSFIDPAIENIYGFKPEEMVRDADRVFQSIHPDDRERVQRELSESARHLSTWYSEYRFYNPAKGLVWTENHFIPERGDEGIISWYGFINDITDQKQKEIKEEVLFDIANATFVTNDLEELSSAIKGHLSRLIDTSNYYIALYDRSTGLLYIPYEQDEKDNIEQWPADKSMTGLVIKNRKALLMKKPDIMQLIDDGVIEQVGNMCEVWMGVPLLAGDEAIGAVVVQDYDNPDVYDEGSREILSYVSYQISLAIQRKKTIDDLVAAKEKAMESDRLKSAFLANMSHEIRTPMNGILGFAELLKEPGLTDDQQKTYIDIIEKSGVRMLNIINDIVDISKIEAGLMEVFPAESDVNEQLEYIYSFFLPQVKEKGMQLTLSATLHAGQATVVTDREKLFAILTNLVKNAVKYSKKGYIDFGCRKKGDFLEFFVIDTGMGIPKDRQEAIFDRFVQADIEDKDALQGAGLGLTISKSYVEMLGGSIRVESEEGKGSSFYFTIPYKTS